MPPVPQTVDKQVAWDGLVQTVHGCVQGTVGKVERAQQHLTREASLNRDVMELSQVWRGDIQGVRDDGV